MNGSAAQGQVDIGGGNIAKSTITTDSVNRRGLEKPRRRL
jgi:molybdopterin-binding protein